MVNAAPQRYQKAIDCLSEFITERRRTLIAHVLARRTRRVTVVLEDIYDPQNASAVVRSSECFGVQDLHVIENMNHFAPNTDVAQGASKWVDIHHYREPDGCNTARCLGALRSAGYEILATGFSPEAVPLPDLSIERPVAICLGTEEAGLSDQAFDLADRIVKIPMFGFTQSFNLSVSAALCLQTVCARIRTGGNDWRLSESEQQKIRLKWMLRSVRNPAALLRKFGFEDMLEELGLPYNVSQFQPK